MAPPRRTRHRRRRHRPREHAPSAADPGRRPASDRRGLKDGWRSSTPARRARPGTSPRSSSRSSVTRAKFISELRDVRKPFGKLDHDARASSRAHTSCPARRTGDYAIVEYDGRVRERQGTAGAARSGRSRTANLARRRLLLPVMADGMLSADALTKNRSRDREVSARPEAVGGDVGARDRAGREGLARDRDDGFRRRATSACRRSPSTRSRRSTRCTTCGRSGKYKITICTNLPCALQDAVDSAEYLKERLGIGFGETTADGRVTLRGRRMHGRLRRRAGAARQQQADVQLHAPRAARRAARRARGRRAAPTDDERARRIAGLRPRRDPDGGPHRRQLAARRLRRARRLRSAAQDPGREDPAGDGDRRSEEVRAARPRRRRLSDRSQVELHAAAVTPATSTSSATPTRASRARSRTATSCATTRTR